MANNERASDPSALLFAFADEREGRRLIAAGLRCLCTGVGKAAAAAALGSALARARFDPAERSVEAVIWVGVAGSYPGGPPVLAGCVVSDAVLADEGAWTERGFLDLDALGLSEPVPPRTDAALTSRVATILDLPLVRAATVSTCSGTDPLADELAERTGARIETMESAAAALACGRAGVPLVEIRCVSNRAGDRARAGWRLREAADRAQELAWTALERGAFAVEPST